MNRKLTHLLPMLSALLLLSPTVSNAQKTAKKGVITAPAEPLEVRLARLDSLAADLESSLESLAVQTADRTDGSNKEKVFAYAAADGSPDSLLVLRNQLDNENGRTTNHFFLRAGKVFCWVLYREESRLQSPRPRKRLTRYYCENGTIFHAIEKAAPAQESLDAVAFNLVPIGEVQNMTEFMNRKFQHLLDAFRQGWKVTGQ